MRSVAMSRERVTEVYRLLLEVGGRGGFTASHLPGVAQRIAPPADRIETVKVVARILGEIGVAREVSAGTFEWTGANSSLETSPTYRRYSALTASFQDVRRIFEGEEGNLRERLTRLESEEATP